MYDPFTTTYYWSKTLSKEKYMLEFDYSRVVAALEITADRTFYYPTKVKKKIFY